jgi:hypothetical protein
VCNGRGLKVVGSDIVERHPGIVIQDFLAAATPIGGARSIICNPSFSRAE